MAQDEQAEVVIMQTTATSQNNGLRMRVFFTVRGQDHRPIPPDKIEAAKIQLSDQFDPVPASIEDPTTPIKIALLLDESGSMRPYIDQVRSAAKDAIDKAPDQAEFAIFRFSDVASTTQISPDLAFTPKSESGKIRDFIDTQYNPQNEAPTCLYNAALQAVRYLAANVQSEERRAIILFTDGKDERANGQPCSDRSLDDVIREAAPTSGSFTPIYTVGLCTKQGCGNVDTTVLTRMASQTNAISAADTLDKLTGLFYQVMDDLRSQKLAQATIAPCEEKQATLLVNVINLRDPIKGIVTFSSDRCYSPRASVKLGVPQPNAGQNLYVFPATIDNLSPINLQGVEVQVIDPNNTSVYTNTLQQPEYEVPAQESKDISIQVPARNMIATGDYTIRILGRTEEGGAFLNQQAIKGQEPDVLGEITFKHVLSSNVEIGIDSVGEPDYTRMTLPVNLHISHKEILEPNLAFLRYEGSIFEGNSELVHINPTQIDLTKADPAFSVDVPLPASVRTIKEPAEYAVALTLLAPQDPRFGSAPQRYEAQRYAFTLKPPPQPSFWANIAPVVGNPFVLIGVLVVVLGAVGMIAFTRSRSRRREIPRPFNPQTIIRPVVAPPAPPAPSPAPKIVAPPPTPPLAQQEATVMHVPSAAEKPRKRLSIRIVKTVDPTQLREQLIGVPCVIGRGAVDFAILGDTKISRAHAEITVENDAFILTDRGSANGTFVNDVRLDQGGSIRLNGRTVVRLGPNTVLELEPRG
jgi:hypothetical protein